MSTCIITSTNRAGSCSATSVMVHLRNALVLKEALGAELVECEGDAWKLDRGFDNVIISYASMYMPWKAYFHRLMLSGARLWWLVNDHDIEDNILLRAMLHATEGARRYNVISNNTRTGYRQWILRKWIIKDRLRLNDCINDWHTVNLNALTYEERDVVPERTELFNYPAIYWGSWRKWRLPYFQKYSSDGIYFSTSPKNARRMRANGCKFHFIPKLRWGAASQLYFANATVYLEDPHTHDNYAFLANRFYEALSYGVDIYFDESCAATAGTVEGAEIIRGPAELRLRAKFGRRQDHSRWRAQARADRQSAIESIRTLMNGAHT